MIDTTDRERRVHLRLVCTRLFSRAFVLVRSSIEHTSVGKPDVLVVVAAVEVVPVVEHPAVVIPRRTAPVEDEVASVHISLTVDTAQGRGQSWDRCEARDVRRWHRFRRIDLDRASEPRVAD